MGLFTKKQKTVEELEQEKIAIEADVEEREARAKVQQEISQLESRKQSTGTLTESAGMKFKQGLSDIRQKFMESQRRKAEERARNPQQVQSQSQRNPFVNPFQNQSPTKQRPTIPTQNSFRFGGVLQQKKPMRFGNVFSDRKPKRKVSAFGGGMTIGDVFGNLNKSQSAIFGGVKPKKIKKRRKKRRKR